MAIKQIVGKGELAHQMAARSGLSLKDAEKALDAFTQVVQENLAHGKEVSLPAHQRVGFSVGTTLSQAAEASKGKSATPAMKR